MQPPVLGSRPALLEPRATTPADTRLEGTLARLRESYPAAVVERLAPLNGVVPRASIQLDSGFVLDLGLHATLSLRGEVVAKRPGYREGEGSDFSEWLRTAMDSAATATLPVRRQADVSELGEPAPKRRRA